MVLPTGTGPLILLSPSPNHSGRDMVVAFTHVGATSSVLSTPRIILKAFPGETPINP